VPVLAGECTAAKVQQWLQAHGFGSSMGALVGVSCQQLMATPKDDLLALTPQGEEIFDLLHGIWNHAMRSDINPDSQ